MFQCSPSAEKVIRYMKDYNRLLKTMIDCGSACAPQAERLTSFPTSFIPSLLAEVEHLRTLADVLTHLFDLVPNDRRPFKLQTLRRL